MVSFLAGDTKAGGGGGEAEEQAGAGGGGEGGTSLQSAEVHCKAGAGVQEKEELVSNLLRYTVRLEQGVEEKRELVSNLLRCLLCKGGGGAGEGGTLI